MSAALRCRHISASLYDMHVSSSCSYGCCLALQLLRRGGNFVCKLFDVFFDGSSSMSSRHVFFDVFTPFVSDLCYLMHQVFDKTCFRV